MLWIIILLVILLPVLWLLLAPFDCIVDTRVPVIKFRWAGIGNAAIVYENEEWWLKVRVLFYYKKWAMMQLIFADNKKKKRFKENKVLNACHFQSWYISSKVLGSVNGR